MTEFMIGLLKSALEKQRYLIADIASIDNYEGNISIVSKIINSKTDGE